MHYGETHHVDEEWVHNAADIDSSKVVWARDADAADNARLLRYFSNRRAWLLDPDAKPPRLVSLSPELGALRLPK